MTDTRAQFDALCRRFSGCGSDYTITDETRLREDLQLDSLDLIDLTIRCDDTFGIEIADDEIDAPETATFGGMLALIEGKLGHEPS